MRQKPEPFNSPTICENCGKQMEWDKEIKYKLNCPSCEDVKSK